MIRKVIAIIVCCISGYLCDNRYNDRYNELVNRGNLKTSIDRQLPKQAKFFDMNDFDCKYWSVYRHYMFLNKSFRQMRLIFVGKKSFFS